MDWSYFRRPGFSDRFTLLLEVKERSELPAFVISPQQCYGGRIGNFEGQQQAEDFNGKCSSVYIVSQEQILSGLNRSSCIWVDDLYEVIELPMNVTDNSHWILDFYQVGLGFCGKYEKLLKI